MNTPIATAHPDTGSLTHEAARRLRQLLGSEVAGVAHLAQEGFDPRFGPSDRRSYLGRGRPGPDVVAGWAFDDADGEVVPKLQRLTAHLLPIAGAQAGVWARHGYAQAFRAQVERGILDFCGVQRGATAFVHDAEAGDEGAVGAAVDTAVTTVASAVTGVQVHAERTVA